MFTTFLYFTYQKIKKFSTKMHQALLLLSRKLKFLFQNAMLSMEKRRLHLLARLLDVVDWFVGNCGSRFVGVSGLSVINHDCLLIWACGKLHIRVNWIVLSQTDDFDGLSLCRTLRVGSLVLNNTHSTGFDWGKEEEEDELAINNFWRF
jgi:hypothetical protein